MFESSDETFLKSHPYKSWEVKTPDEYDWDDIGYDGHGYVLINGHRYDAEVDMYKEGRERWNKLKSK